LVSTVGPGFGAVIEPHSDAATYPAAWWWTMSAQGFFLLSIVMHTLQDRRRKRREAPLGDAGPSIVARDEAFDRAWVLGLAERAMDRLREDGSPYYAVLREHLAGKPQDRNRVWIARRKIIALIREEIAFTCASQAQFEEEVAYLSPFLRPKNNETKSRATRRR
jgi:hypothetical protein